MTHHNEATGPHEYEGADPDASGGRARRGLAGRSVPHSPPTTHPGEPSPPTGPGPIALSSPADLAHALPYVLGYRPEDSAVLIALHQEPGGVRLGARARLDIPRRPEAWSAAAEQLARGLIGGCRRRGAEPDALVVFLCREPEKGEDGRAVMGRLRPLAQLLRTVCGSLDVPVTEALCVSAGRFWSYCCPSERCCPPEGVALGLGGTSTVAAAATYLGLQVRGGLGDFRARLVPWEGEAARTQERALDRTGLALIPRMLDEEQRPQVAVETVDLALDLINRLTAARRTPIVGEQDRRDDALVTDTEAASLIFGLQDRTTRDRAARWMEGEEVRAALRLWRVLARRCVGTYGEYAAAPLALAGWAAWSGGDELEGRVAFAMALAAEPGYIFAQLLHEACNEGFDPEEIRSCLRGGDDRMPVVPRKAARPRGARDRVRKPGHPASPPAGTGPRSRRPGRSRGRVLRGPAPGRSAGGPNEETPTPEAAEGGDRGTD